MADTTRSSFIPKQTKSTGTNVARRRRYHIVGIIANVLFFSALVLAAGVFFYQDYTNKQLIEVKNELNEERLRFNESDIERVRAFDMQLKAVKYLLNKHLSPSRVFDALEFSTLEQVMYTGMDYTRTENGASIQLTGATEELSTLAVQSIELSSASVLSERILGGIGDALEENNSNDSSQQGDESVLLPEVTFQVEVTVPSEEISYTGGSAAVSDNIQNTETIPEETEDDLESGDSTEEVNIQTQ